MQNDNNDIEFKCSECGESFPQELIENYILKGKQVYCEYCGTPFRSDLVYSSAKSNLSSPQKLSKFDRVSGYLNKRNGVEPASNINITTDSAGMNYRKEAYKPPQIEKPRMTYSRSRTKDTSNKRYDERQFNSSRSVGVRIQPRSDKFKEKVKESDIKSIEGAINFFVNLNRSPLMVLIVLIISIGRLFAFNALNPLVVLEIISRLILFMIWFAYISSNVLKAHKEKDYSDYGVSAILFGLIGLQFYGFAGVLVILEGVLILVRYIALQHNSLVDHLGKPTGINYSLLALNIIENSVMVLTNHMFNATLLITLLIIPSMLSITGGFVQFYIYFIIGLAISIALINYIKMKLVPEFSKTPIKDLSEDLLVGALILGIFGSIFGGTGGPMLACIILIYIYRNLLNETERKMEIQKLGSKFATDQSEQPLDTPFNKTFVPNYNADHETSTDKGNQIPSEKFHKSVESKEQTPVGEKHGVTDVELKAPALDDNLKEIKEEEHRKSREKERIESFIGRIFTVLTEDIRNRLLDLDIDKEEKEKIIKEFVYLKEDQQRKYLDELESVNRKISKDLIKRINKMNISDKEKQDLIKQLDYMNPQDRLGFIQFIETEMTSKH